jgi:hypothetical protein
MESFSREGLINQLEYDGFTEEQAEYGVTVPAACPMPSQPINPHS